MNHQRWWVVFLFFVTIRAFECPDGPGCDNCRTRYEQVYEINCHTSLDSIVEVQIQPDNYVRLTCRNSANWTNFHLGTSHPINGIKSLSFDACNLPEANGLGSIARRLISDSIETLYFRYETNKIFNLTRNNLRDLSALRELTLTSINLMNIPDDLLYDLKNLTRLNLQNTNLNYLPKNLFVASTSLEAIELSTNDLVTLDSSSFGKLSRLRLLNIWNNKLARISSNTFDELVSLETLNLRRNRLDALPNDVFKRLVNLRILRLSENNFTSGSLGSDLLRKFKNLRIFELMHNRRNMTTMENGFFANLTTLGTIKLTKIGLISLPEDLFWGTMNLQNLSIDRNYLFTLPRKIFNDNHGLLTLDLNFNDLTYLPDGVFANLRKLVKLDLSRNHLTTISENLFSGLTSLRELNMERNNMIAIHSHALGSLRKLRVARFSYNSLTLEFDKIVHESPFHYSEGLEELHLDHNNISNIFVDWLFSMGSIKLLNLSYNKLRFLMHEDLQFLSQDLRVDLTHNEISHVYLDGVEKWASERAYSRNLIVSVNENPIECDCDIYDLLRYFEGRLHNNVRNAFNLKIGKTRCSAPEELRDNAIIDLKSMTFKCNVSTTKFEGDCPNRCSCYVRPENKACLINCAEVGLTEAPEKIECPSDHWIELNLSSNALTVMPNFRQTGYDRVTVLALDHNNISSLSIEALSPNLKALRLNNNDLSRVDRGVIDFFDNSTQLTELTLESNPWLCDCETREFVSFVQKNSVEMPDLRKVKCNGRDRPIFKITPDEICRASTDRWIIGGCAVAFFGIIVGFLACLYCRYRRELKVWLYAKNWCLWYVTESELDKDKLFDAFISYSHKDEDFVVNDLMTNLEAEPRSFKLCVHFRDWLIGEWITKQIARSVEASRRTIVVLSPNFLESVWGRMEFRAAHSQALSEGRARVIMILYGDIGPTDELDPELRAYLSMNTYVKWGDPWFWEKLNYAMPHPAELTRQNLRRNILAATTKPRDTNDKRELIDSSRVAATQTSVPAASPTDSVKIFIDNDATNKEYEISESK